MVTSLFVPETYDKSKDELYKLSDRGGSDFILSPVGNNIQLFFSRPKSR